MAIAADSWSAVGIVSFELWQRLTSSFGWTFRPSSRALREVGDDLVHVGVRRGARAGLIDVDRELGVMASVGDLRGGGSDRRRDIRIEEAELLVGLGGGELDERERPQEPARQRPARDREVEDGPLGGGAVQGVGRDLHLAHRIALDAGGGSASRHRGIVGWPGLADAGRGPGEVTAPDLVLRTSGAPSAGRDRVSRRRATAGFVLGPCGAHSASRGGCLRGSRAQSASKQTRIEGAEAAGSGPRSFGWWRMRTGWTDWQETCARGQSCGRSGPDPLAGPQDGEGVTDLIGDRTVRRERHRHRLRVSEGRHEHDQLAVEPASGSSWMTPFGRLFIDLGIASIRARRAVQAPAQPIPEPQQGRLCLLWASSGGCPSNAGLRRDRTAARPPAAPSRHRSAR